MEATADDKFVAYDLLKNANIAAGGVLPMCQDTGTAIVVAKKGRRVWTDGLDVEALSEGIARRTVRRTCATARLRRFRRSRSGTQATISRRRSKSPRRASYSDKFLFIAKGGGSANKTFLYQATPSILTHERMIAFLKEKIPMLGSRPARPITSPSSSAA